MKTTLIFAIVAATNATQAIAAEPRAPFVPRMTTLAGARLQPSSGLHASSSLQAAQGTEPSAADRGRAPIVTRPMTEARWRAMFPRKAGER